MKKLVLTHRDVAPLILLIVSLTLMLTGILLKSFVVIAGVTGMIAAWFLCIDTLITNHQLSIIKKIVFGSIVIALPIIIAFYMGS